MVLTKFSELLRRKTVRFIVVFVASVFLLLEVHGVIVNTVVSDFYLYQVAKSTAWLLRLVGESAEAVGSHRTYPGREAFVRASMAAWQKGQDTPAPEHFQGLSGPPLNSWERWRYSAVSHRRELEQLLKTWDGSSELWRSDPFNKANVEKVTKRIQLLQSRELGPTVVFVLRRGATSQVAGIRREIAKAYLDPGSSKEQRLARVARAKPGLQEVEKKRAKQVDNAPEAVDDLSFTFVVVPDCGAIPIMAIFIAAVLAFPACLWEKLFAMGIGLPFLYGVNTLRLTVLAVLGAWNHGGAVFKFAHEYVWQGIYIVFVVIAWLAWVELLVRRRKT